MPRIEYIDEPNLIVPLAASFNQRGLKGYTQAVTNADDQLKVNSIYEPVRNALTDKVTLYLCKRPGVVDSGNTYGTSSQVAYLSEIDPEAFTNGPLWTWVFSKNGNDIVAASRTSTSVVSTAIGFAPAFVDKYTNSIDTYAILQIRNAAGDQSAFLSDSLITGWSEITDADFTGLDHQGKMEFLDGYALISTPRSVYNSELNTVSTWTASAYIDRQINQDPGIGLARLGKQIISFGTASFEVFRNAGTAFGSPLESVHELSQRYGLADTNVVGMRHYSVVIDGRLYWRGSNPEGVFAYNGSVVEKVSPLAVDKILAERQHYYVSRIGLQGQVALVIGLDLPSATTQRALLFFPEWKDWFIWESTVFMPLACWRSERVCLGIGGNTHKVFEVSVSTENFQDAGTNYTWTHQFKVPKRGNGFQKMDMFGLVGDTASSAQLINVQFSDNDYSSFSAARTIDMSGTDKMITRCGGYRSRAVKLSYAGDQALRVEAAMARIS